jgi:hypothetical protein
VGRESFEKRQREKKRQERAAEKRQRRETRGDEAENPEVEDTEALMERFRVLSEQHAAGIVDAETYEAERLVIFELLGLADPLNT